MCIVRMIDGG